MTEPELKRVHRFWDVEACGTHLVREPSGTRAFWSRTLVTALRRCGGFAKPSPLK